MPNATRFLAGLATLALLTACGGDGGGATPAVPPTSVTSTQPADGSTKVDIRPAISVVLSASVDPASVTATHVQLLSHGYPQRITTRYDDATHTLTVTAATLRHDTAYTLSVSGLVDAGGQAIAARQATFSTSVNAPLKGTAGDGTPLFTATLDANGRLLKGPDPDDITSGNYRTYAYLANGQLSDATTWTLGADLKTYVVQRVAHAAYDTHGALLTVTTTRSDYPTGAPHAQDTLDTFTYDGFGAQVLDKTATAGADGKLGTPDDALRYVSTTRDAQGNVTFTVTGTQVGSDGLTIPAAAVSAYTTHTLAAADVPETFVNYIDAGLDGVWFTGDDLTTTDTEITRDARGNVTRRVDYRHPSGVHLGGGVTIIDVVVTTYDGHDNAVTQTTYDAAGADGVWFTADDEVATVVSFDTAH